MRTANFFSQEINSMLYFCCGKLIEMLELFKMPNKYMAASYHNIVQVVFKLLQKPTDAAHRFKVNEVMKEGFVTIIIYFSSTRRVLVLPRKLGPV